MSRREMETWDGLAEKPFAIISITCPDQEDAKLPEKENLKDVLRLSFHDVDRPYSADELPKGVRIFPFTWDMARAVARWVWCLPQDLELLVVHCEAGISRSVGMADAIASVMLCRRLGPHGLPNALVRKLTQEAMFEVKDLYAKK